jgi:hypothetical protein
MNHCSESNGSTTAPERDETGTRGPRLDARQQAPALRDRRRRVARREAIEPDVLGRRFERVIFAREGR